MPDIIVTGIPRAGSAMVSALIDYLPDAIAFNAPPRHIAWARSRVLRPVPYCKWLVGDFVWTRRMLLNQESVGDIRAADGSPLFDGLLAPRQTIHPAYPKNDAEESDDTSGIVSFTRPGLTPDFILAMRHHTFYTSLLPTIVRFGHFKVIAVIRHPLDVLNSWRRLPQPMIARGKPHGISRFWPEALALMETKMEAADRFVQLYDAYLKRYHELREQIHIVKYEDIVENPLMVSQLLGVKGLSPGAARIERRQRVRITAEANIFRERFRKYGLYTKFYYPDI